VVGHDQAFGLLSRMVREQARVIAYLDIFWLFWVMILATIPLVFLMTKSVAKGELAAH
jgi:MFS transporter, DHA2 family, multidrug resistance protein